MRKSATSENTNIMGWREWVSLPDLGIKQIKAKIDTGARSSSLHAYHIEFFERDGVDMVRFHVHPRQRETRSEVCAEAPLVARRHVKSSTGHQTLRPVIITNMMVAGQSWPIELTLANRDLMGFRMLLGRQALRGRVVIDPGRSFVTGQPKKRRKKRKKGKSS